MSQTLLARLPNGILCHDHIFHLSVNLLQLSLTAIPRPPDNYRGAGGCASPVAGEVSVYKVAMSIFPSLPGFLMLLIT
jgi:hypothetical protein